MISNVYDLDNILTLDKKVPDSTPSFPYLWLELEINRFPICTFPPTWDITPKKTLPDIEGQKDTKTRKSDLQSEMFSKKDTEQKGEM